MTDQFSFRVLSGTIENASDLVKNFLRTKNPVIDGSVLEIIAGYYAKIDQKVRDKLIEAEEAFHRKVKEAEEDHKKEIEVLTKKLGDAEANLRKYTEDCYNYRVETRSQLKELGKLEQTVLTLQSELEGVKAKAKAKSKQRFPDKFKDPCWKFWFSIEIRVLCPCCGKTYFEKSKNEEKQTYHFGHIEAYSISKSHALTNVIPICMPCNIDMHTTNMKQYMLEKYNRTHFILPGDPQYKTPSTETPSSTPNTTSTPSVKARPIPTKERLLNLCREHGLTGFSKLRIDDIKSLLRDNNINLE